MTMCELSVSVFIIRHTSAKSGRHCSHSKMCVCVCVCVFIELHITAQSGPVILVILCHSLDPPKGGSMMTYYKTL